MFSKQVLTLQCVYRVGKKVGKLRWLSGYRSVFRLKLRGGVGWGFGGEWRGHAALERSLDPFQPLRNLMCVHACACVYVRP